jgi:predicted transcriptional regulator
MDHMELLGSKARLEVLRSLSRGDMYVSEIIEEVGMDGKTAKHHLDALEEAGVVETYKEGRRIYYRLVREVRLEISPSPDRRFVLRFPDAD